jgi:hypothetical protein
MSGSLRRERCLILLELAEKIALEDPLQRHLRILHENNRHWQVLLGDHPSAGQQDVVFPTLEQALEDFVLHWPRPWLGT